MPYIGICFRFYTQMRLQKNPKHLHVEFMVTSHNSVDSNVLRILKLQIEMGNFKDLLYSPVDLHDLTCSKCQNVGMF